jgi:N-acetylneuraminate synthase
LHCTTEYPASLDEVNLLAMQTLKAAFGLPVGYSDHTEGINVPVAAAALGARVIEKHFTIDRSLPGPDHRASLEPFELRLMVAGVREVERALGRPSKVVVPIEQANRLIARKSLVARKAIHAGELFTTENLTVKRPGTGIPAIEYFEWLGQAADRSYAADDLIQR